MRICGRAFGTEPCCQFDWYYFVWDFRKYASDKLRDRQLWRRKKDMLKLLWYWQHLFFCVLYKGRDSSSQVTKTISFFLENPICPLLTTTLDLLKFMKSVRIFTCLFDNFFARNGRCQIRTKSKFRKKWPDLAMTFRWNVRGPYISHCL